MRRCPSCAPSSRPARSSAVDAPAPNEEGRAADVLIVGGDALTLRVCEELCRDGRSVTVLWRDDRHFERLVRATGAGYVASDPRETFALEAAGVRDARALMALTDEDHLNLQVSLRARDLNGRVRLVMRQYNRTLGRKVEQNLPNCSVISLSSHSAATYAARAVDHHCFYGLQFPDIDGPLVGFAKLTAEAAGVDGLTVDEAERRLEARILAVGGLCGPARTAALDADATLETFGAVRPTVRLRARSRLASRFFVLRAHALTRPLQHALAALDPVIRRVIAVAIVFVVAATAWFTESLHLDWRTAFYFVATTMTTTGYGDITPQRGDWPNELAAVMLMVGGLTFSGIFIAILTTRLTRAQFDAVQGLRPIGRRGHIVVCGAGNVGSRVIDFLLRLGRQVVVVELTPRPNVVELSRERRIDLLTGDATLDSTLDFCNVEEAEAIVALTDSDTRNLEVALGARARNPTVPVIMRVQEETFERSVRAHFGFMRVHGTAALAAPVFAGLSRERGMRGRVVVGETAFAVAELDGGAPASARWIPLAAWRDGALVLLHAFEDARAGDRVLFLAPPAPGASPARAG